MKIFFLKFLFKNWMDHKSRTVDCPIVFRSDSSRREIDPPGMRASGSHPCAGKYFISPSSFISHASIETAARFVSRDI